MNIFIYRPDRMQSDKINPDLCYTLKGQPLREWQRDQDEIYNYRISKAKKKEVPDYKVFDYWR